MLNFDGTLGRAEASFDMLFIGGDVPARLRQVVLNHLPKSKDHPDGEKRQISVKVPPARRAAAPSRSDDSGSARWECTDRMLL